MTRLMVMPIPRASQCKHNTQHRLTFALPAAPAGAGGRSQPSALLQAGLIAQVAPGLGARRSMEELQLVLWISKVYHCRLQAAGPEALVIQELEVQVVAHGQLIPGVVEEPALNKAVVCGTRGLAVNVTQAEAGRTSQESPALPRRAGTDSTRGA